MNLPKKRDRENSGSGLYAVAKRQWGKEESLGISSRDQYFPRFIVGA